MSAVEEQKIRNTGRKDQLAHTLRRHVLNVRRRPNQYGLSFGKASRDSPQKIDAYAATLLADLARHRLVESGKERTPDRSGAVYFF